MLTESEAKKIGIDACINIIGVDFCKKHRDSACVSYGVNDGIMFCGLGIDDTPLAIDKNPSKLVLSETSFKYTASCNVYLQDGHIEYLECITP